MRPNCFLIACVASLVGLAGCAGPRSNIALQDAHAAYDRAARDANARQYAPLALEDANRQLNDAQALWEQGADTADIDHAAYLAQRKAEIAVAKGQTDAATAELKTFDARRQQLVAQVKTRDAEQANQRADRLQQELNARQTERGTVFTMPNDILFDVGQSTLKPGADLSLDRLAAFLRENGNHNLLVEGFTDSTGPEDLNRRLSEQRAEAVRDALTQRGIDPARIRTRGYGENYPVASNATSAGKQMNRRVEIVMANGSGQVAERRADSGCNNC